MGIRITAAGYEFTLGALQANFGHQDFGVYATVIEGGPLALGDDWALQ